MAKKPEIEKNIDESVNVNQSNDSMNPTDSPDENESATKEERIKKRAKSFVRVGGNYHKFSWRPTIKGKPYKVLVPWVKQSIVDDYGREIIKYINKYDGFVTMPSHTDYQQSVSNWYNQYYQISHLPKAGKFNNIMTLLNHVFGEKYMDFILDYIQLMYQQPTRNLPIILLESKARNSGKSTFGILIEKIFQENTITLGNADLSSQFNDVWVQKLAIIVDEASLQESAIGEMIKRLSTREGTTLANGKNKGQTNVEFIGKFIFMSNKEGNALPIERGENRYAVFKVLPLATEDKEKGKAFQEKLEAEIPAFLHFLSSRTLIHPDKGRMYFAPEIYFTDQLKLYFEGNLGYMGKAIKQLITDTFEMFPEEEKLCFSLSNMLDEIMQGKYLRYADRPQIRKAIEDELNLELSKKGRYTYFSRHKGETEKGYFPLRNDPVNTYYTFDRENYFNSYENSTISSSKETLQTAIF